MKMGKKAKADFVAAARLDPSSKTIRKLIDKANRMVEIEKKHNKRLAKAIAKHVDQSMKSARLS